MRVLWLNHRDPNHPLAGGAEVHLREVCKRLVNRGCDVTLLSERFPGSAETEVLDGIRIIRKGDRVGVHIRAPLLVSKLAREHDVVVDDIAHAVPWWSRLVTRRPVVGIIHHVHQNVVSLELNFPLDVAVKFAERTIKFAYNRIITDSEATKREIVALLGVPPNHVRVVYLGVDHNFYGPSKEKFGDPTLLWVGNIKRYKNVDHLLSAFALAKKRVPNLRLVVDGDGYYKNHIVQLAERLGLDGVSFVHPLIGEEKVRLFGRSWALCVTSVVEGWGLVITEAAACGTPSIAYNSGASSEAVVDGETGLLVRYGDIKNLAEKIELVATDPRLREALSLGAIQYSQKFDWERTTDETFNVLREAVDNQS
jgi:glycosyltransferase involved in cell wall biosynthesis